MKISKRILAMLIVSCMILWVMPALQVAADPIEVTTFEGLKQALSAPGDATIKIMNNITIVANTDHWSQRIMIEAEGKKTLIADTHVTVTWEAGGFFVYGTGRNLTIDDPGNNFTFTTTATVANGPLFTVENGELIINGGNYNHIYAGDGNAPLVNISGATALLEINSGTFNDLKLGYGAIYANNGATVRMNGGTLTNYFSQWGGVNCGIFFDNGGGTLEWNGGDISDNPADYTGSQIITFSNSAAAKNIVKVNRAIYDKYNKCFDGLDIDLTVIDVNALPTGVTVSPKSVSLGTSGSKQLTATVLPHGTTHNGVEWSSSNPAVATVTNNGLVEAKAVGNATITVTTTEGDPVQFSDTCEVEVTAISKLSGTPMGAGDTYGGGTIEEHVAKAFDGNINTNPDINVNGWIGLDLGGKYKITSIKYHPRLGWPSRANGKYQAANSADFSDAVIIATVSGVSAEDWGTVDVTDQNTYQYVRFISDQWNDIAEIEFYGSVGGEPTLDPSVSIASGTVTVANAPATCVLIIASYNGTRLIDAKSINNATGSYTIANEISTTDSTSVKAFLWDNITNIKPLCNSAS